MALIVYFLGALLGFVTSLTAVVVFKVGFGHGALIYFSVGILSPLLLSLAIVVFDRVNSMIKMNDRSIAQLPEK